MAFTDDLGLGEDLELLLNSVTGSDLGTEGRVTAERRGLDDFVIGFGERADALKEATLGRLRDRLRAESGGQQPAIDSRPGIGESLRPDPTPFVPRDQGPTLLEMLNVPGRINDQLGSEVQQLRDYYGNIGSSINDAASGVSQSFQEGAAALGNLIPEETLRTLPQETVNRLEDAITATAASTPGGLAITKGVPLVSQIAESAEEGFMEGGIPGAGESVVEELTGLLPDDLVLELRGSYAFAKGGRPGYEKFLRTVQAEQALETAAAKLKRENSAALDSEVQRRVDEVSDITQTSKFLRKRLEPDETTSKFAEFDPGFKEVDLSDPNAVLTVMGDRANFQFDPRNSAKTFTKTPNFARDDARKEEQKQRLIADSQGLMEALLRRAQDPDVTQAEAQENLIAYQRASQSREEMISILEQVEASEVAAGRTPEEVADFFARVEDLLRLEGLVPGSDEYNERLKQLAAGALDGRY